MLAYPHHQHSHHFFHFHFHLNPNPSSTTTVYSSFHHHHHPPQDPPTTSPSSTTNNHDPKLLQRTHNSKSTSILLHQLHPSSHLSPLPPQPHQPHLLLDPSHLIPSPFKRPPQFPGSVSLHPSTDPFYEQKGDDLETEAIMRALEVRRKVTVEIFKEEMRRKGKFGITYSTNLVDRLGDFADFLVIEAVGLKRLPEFRLESFNVRVKAVIDDLEVVPLVRWLKHNGVSYPKIAKIICFSRGNVESIRHLAEWLKSIHVKGEFLGVVLTKVGEIILQRSKEELDEIVDYLENNGVKRDWIGYVMSRCPQLLCYTMEEVKTRVEFYLAMGMNKKDFGTMVFDFPRVLGYYTLEQMNEKVSYLKEFGLNDEDVGRLLAFKPQLMGCSIEERWKPLVKYLYYFGISRDGMRRMLIIKPMVFCVDLEQTIVPKVRFFQDIGIRDEAIGNMLVKFPPLLTYSLYKKIRPVVVFLMTKAGVTERDIGKVIALGPELLSCNIGKKLEVNMKYFLSLGISIRQLGQMIADFPMLLRYNVDLLHPKYKYLRRIMVRPLQDVIEFPRFFSYSLEERIIPRHKIMVENRINFKLRYMLACTDEEFQKKVEAAGERRRSFESRARDQLADDSSKENTANLFGKTEVNICCSQVNDRYPTRSSDFVECGDVESSSEL